MIGQSLLAFAALLLGAPLAPGGQDTPALKELVVRSRDGNKWVRKRAIEQLAARGEGRAWEVVLDALADRSGEVADAAQWCLADLGAGPVREALLGRAGLGARDERVRRRAAEVLGRLERDVDDALFEALGDALSDRDPETRRLVAFSLQRLSEARSAALPEAVRRTLVHRLAREREPDVRARLLAAAGSGGALRVEELDSWLRDPSALVRAAAAQARGRLGGAGCGLALRDALSDEAASVRLHAAWSLRAHPEREAALVLVDRLALESAPRVLDALVADLRAYSGKRYRRDPRPWRDWLTRLPEDWVPPVVPLEEAPAADGPEASRSELFGLPITSRHVTFLIDLSGSMWTKDAEGKTRKDHVGRALSAALASLAKGTEFNLIPYSTAPHPLWKEQRRATRTSTREALRFFERAGDQGSGNLWSALLLALADPDLETLVILTDGAPTGGVHNRLDLLVPLLLERAEFRALVVDSVLVDAPKKLRQQWVGLAAKTGGRSVSAAVLGP